jgi:hypothetical protein
MGGTSNCTGVPLTDTVMPCELEEVPVELFKRLFDTLFNDLFKPVIGGTEMLAGTLLVTVMPLKG